MGGNVERHIGDDGRDETAIEALQPGGAWGGRPINDAWINEITLDSIGKWPSFEAQSWACKVTHAVLAALTPAPDAILAKV